MFIHLRARSVPSACATSLQSLHQVLVRVHGEISLQERPVAYSAYASNGNRFLPGYQADNQAQPLEGLNVHSVHDQPESSLIYSNVWLVLFRKAYDDRSGKEQKPEQSHRIIVQQ